MGTEDGCVVLYEITPTGVEYHRTLDRQEGRMTTLLNTVEPVSNDHLSLMTTCLQ